MECSLDKLTIKGFKSIKSLENFELKNLNILIGGNGAGKSNFIDFFRMISAMMKPSGLKEFIAGNADVYLFGGPKETKQIVIKMVLGANGYDFELSSTEDGFFLINNEQVHYFPHDATKNLGSGNFDSEILLWKDVFDIQIPPSMRKKIFDGDYGVLNDTRNWGHNASWYTYNAICSWKIYHFHDTSKEAGMRRYQDIGHNEKLETDASNIAPFLLKLRDNYRDAYQEIIETVRLVIPFFDDFILKSENGNSETLRLCWRQKGLKDYPMRPNQLSDGAIRFICLTTALLQPKPPSTIIIDEPELGLHPYAIEILAELLHAASKRMQVIVSTQSPALVDCFEPNDVIVVNRKDGASTFQHLNTDELSVWLEDYSLGNLWCKNVISGGPSHE